MLRYNENTVIEAEAKQNLGATVLNLNDDDAEHVITTMRASMTWRVV